MERNANATPSLSFPQELLPCLQGELRMYQLTGVRWLASLHAASLSGILADQLPRDRQVQVIGLFAFLRSQGTGGPFLVVTAQDQVHSWTSELQRLLPERLAMQIHGAIPSDASCSPSQHVQGEASDC
jgi:SNF2 family DNA or RNA helicase